MAINTIRGNYSLKTFPLQVLFFLLSFSALLLSLPLANRTQSADVIAIARQYIGIKENPDGSNRGKEVDVFNQTAGADKGSYWCMSFVYTMYHLSGNNKLLKTASCWQQLKYAKRFASGLKVLPVGKQWGTVQTKPGDIGILSHDGIDEELIGGAWNGHCFLIEQDGRTNVKTIEGNTNTNGSRNGNQVAERQREKRKILAAIRVTN